MCRAFHRLLADILSRILEFTSRQRAFVKGDGIADNVFFLRCLLRDMCEEVKPLSLAFLDVSKAFDSVLHESLLLAVKRMGCLGPLLNTCAASMPRRRLPYKLATPLAEQ